MAQKVYSALVEENNGSLPTLEEVKNNKNLIKILETVDFSETVFRGIFNNDTAMNLEKLYELVNHYGDDEIRVKTYFVTPEDLADSYIEGGYSEEEALEEYETLERFGESYALDFYRFYQFPDGSIIELFED